MASEHTPGPWEVKNRTTVVSGSEQVAWTGFKSGDWPKEVYETERANARLISAAPDLLAACEAMLKDLREVRDTGTCSRSRDSQIRDLSDAIAKARGGVQ